MVDSVDLPAVGGGVVAWVVVWFVLGYALYATVFGTLGSLASRTEDASSVAGPVTVVLVLGFFVSFATIGSPDTTWAQLVSWFPLTAPLAMPNRIAMGAASWWEPLLAVVLTLAAIAVLVALGGRVYTRAILHTGSTLSLGDAWRWRTHGDSRRRPGPSRSRALGGGCDGCREPCEGPAGTAHPGRGLVGVGWCGLRGDHRLRDRRRCRRRVLRPRRARHSGLGSETAPARLEATTART